MWNSAVGGPDSSAVARSCRQNCALATLPSRHTITALMSFGAVMSG